MTELSENQVQTESTSIINHRSRSGFWFGVIILLTVIGIAGVGFFLFQQLREQQEDLGGEISRDYMKMVELTKQITGYQTQLAAIQRQLTDLNAEIAGKDDFYNKKLLKYPFRVNKKDIEIIFVTNENEMNVLSEQLGIEKNKLKIYNWKSKE